MQPANVNRYARGISMATRANAALAGFERFQPGCGATEVLDFVGWLRTHNDRTRAAEMKPVLWSRSLQPLRLDSRNACLFG
jgi:erythromycin esterase-like protein